MGSDVAAALDAHFADPTATPAELAEAVLDLGVPIHHNPHIAAAALRGKRKRVRRTGRWLVRHGTRLDAVVLGLALLAEDHDDRDIPLIQTIGLLSTSFGPLAAHALRRRPGGGAALLWLAARTTGWGRVYVMEALCAHAATAVREWLLRHGLDGNYLDGYYVGPVATVSYLAEAIRADEVDDEILGQTARVLLTMAGNHGMGATLANYPPAPTVLGEYLRHLSGRPPTMPRYLSLARLADHLDRSAPTELSCTPAQRDRLLADYLALLDRDDWAAAGRAGFDPANEYHVWFANDAATRLGLRALAGFAAG
ncbi:hypothetical protein K7640_13825 [Micromonospora sp. PLK6-60]|uniref:hypothetical protein n=1 Tax=Micromonospora sp. PLK6-60 TaxID=2873383 RepID=UPI001CA628AB|nr:hypothetical protein [Micromonospora sp. PLK6-60]MBY8872911.1 hypothetical protein [Micromonospora sp. PLK6-60]